VPFYEYRRPDGTTFEVLQKMSDPALTHDPETGVPVERVFHPIAVHFKGKGFYNTDYGTRKRNAEKASEGGDAKPAPDGKGGSEGAKAGSDAKSGSGSPASSSSSASSGD
jgi:predicted nucleic acid-binding Zn ribbon protein